MGFQSRKPKAKSRRTPSGKSSPPEDSEPMDTRVFCVYNVARGVFLSSKVTAVFGVNEPLRILEVLVGGLGRDTKSGLWISPLSATPSVPRLFPFDLLYLDRDQRVLEAVEIVSSAEFPAYRREVESALVLARRTAESTQTERGDRLIICVEGEVDRQIAAAEESELAPMAAGARSSAGKFRGLFDLKDAEQGAAVSAVLTKPFSPVTTRLAEGPVPVTDSANTCAVALEHPAVQPAVGQADVECEGRVSDSSAIEPEMDGVEAKAGTTTTRAEVPQLAMLVPDVAGISTGIAGDPIQSAIDRSTKNAAPDEGRDAIPSNGAHASITEAIVENPGSLNSSVVTGQQGGLEDLFSNWVDAPSSSRAWIPRNPRPGGAPIIPPAPSLEASTSSEKNASAVESDLKASKTASSQQIIESENAVPQIAAVAPAPDVGMERPKANGDAPTATSEPTQAPMSTKSATVLAPPTTTVTVANFGMWRASAATAIGSLAAVPTRTEKRPAAPAREELTSKARETSNQEKPTTVAKAAEGPAEALAPSSASGLAGAAGFARGNVRAAGAMNVRESLEMAASKTGKDKIVLTSGAASQGITDESTPGAFSESAEPRSAEPLTMATKASAAAIPEKKPSIQVASDLRGRLSGKPAELRSSVSPAAAKETAQKSQPEASAAKAGISAQRAAAGPKRVKSESEGVKRTTSAVAKAGPNDANGRKEANGKSKSGPPSLGERFKRWLNPVDPVASDRRRAYRRFVPGMVAHYYSGGAPKPHDVADISMTGFYLLTEDRWMPDTMIQMTLQKPCARGERKQSITVLSKIVRRGSDGVAAEFVMAEGLDSMSRDIQPSQATDRFTLARFL